MRRQMDLTQGWSRAISCSHLIKSESSHLRTRVHCWPTLGPRATASNTECFKRPTRALGTWLLSRARISVAVSRASLVRPDRRRRLSRPITASGLAGDTKLTQPESRLKASGKWGGQRQSAEIQATATVFPFDLPDSDCLLCSKLRSGAPNPGRSAWFAWMVSALASETKLS